MPLAQKLQQLVEDLAVLEDPQERLWVIVDRAKRLPPLPAAERIDENRVRGCVSVVWLLGEVREGHCHFRSDADSPVVRGLLAVLCDFFSGFPPEMVATSEVDPLETLGITRNLSPTRRNGLNAARLRIRELAAHWAQAEKN